MVGSLVYISGSMFLLAFLFRVGQSIISVDFPLRVYPLVLCSLSFWNYVFRFRSSYSIILFGRFLCREGVGVAITTVFVKQCCSASLLIWNIAEYIYNFQSASFC